ncbi:hypothetical protein F7725_007670, partial [Dissostichus mawsoni]
SGPRSHDSGSSTGPSSHGSGSSTGPCSHGTGSSASPSSHGGPAEVDGSTSSWLSEADLAASSSSTVAWLWTASVDVEPLPEATAAVTESIRVGGSIDGLPPMASCMAENVTPSQAFLAVCLRPVNSVSFSTLSLMRDSKTPFHQLLPAVSLSSPLKVFRVLSLRALRLYWGCVSVSYMQANEQ